MKNSLFPRSLIILALALSLTTYVVAKGTPRLTIQTPTEGQTIQPMPALGPVAIVKFTTDNFKIDSVDKGHGSITDMATQEHPDHGYVQVTVDDSPWFFIHSDNDPIVVSGLSPGKHSVKLQLVGPNYAAIGAAQTVNFIIGSETGR